MSRLLLHGYPVSNYVNVVRAALIEKSLDHELVVTGAAKDERFLAMNPMGKIPVLEDDGIFVGETVAILDYLDDRYPENSLRPLDIAPRARGRQIINIMQMYVEAPARTLFPGVFMGTSNAPQTVANARAMLDRSTAALKRLIEPTPFVLGEAISQADLFCFYNLDIVERLARFVWGRSIISEIGVQSWHAMMAERPSSRSVLADFETYFARYLADKGAVYRAPEPGIHVHA
jgi:glutathione S-transferase